MKICTDSLMELGFWSAYMLQPFRLTLVSNLLFVLSMPFGALRNRQNITHYKLLHLNYHELNQTIVQISVQFAYMPKLS